MTDLLETIESELNDNSLNKELKRITNKLRTLLKKEENLVNLRLEGKISDTIYNEKYNEISSEKEFLAEEKVNIETTLKSEIDVKKRLTEFKHLLSSQKMLTEFDRAVFESIVEKIIVGGVNSDGEIDPAMLTIIFKTGETQNKDGKQFKSKRKNAKLETDKLCPQNSDEDKKLYSQGTDYTHRSCGIIRKTQLDCPVCSPVFWQAASKGPRTFELSNTHHVDSCHTYTKIKCQQALSRVIA